MIDFSSEKYIVLHCPTFYNVELSPNYPVLNFAFTEQYGMLKCFFGVNVLDVFTTTVMKCLIWAILVFLNFT